MATSSEAAAAINGPKQQENGELKPPNEDRPQTGSPMFPFLHQIKREPAHRVFVNRSLQLSKIKFFGFDMDYTLALYKSPQYEILAFNLVVDQLLKLGYPKDIKSFVYDPTFPVRGLWYDKLYGNLLKTDSYGNILVCVHGFKFLKSNEIFKLYPNKYLHFDESRCYALNTLFALPEIYLLACLINYFTTSPLFEYGDTGVRSGDIFVSFKAIFQDVRQAIDHVHNDGDLKRLTVENLNYYVVKDERLGTLFDRMHENNGKVFLLTNSGYEYTDQIMGFLLNDEKKNRHWKSYFDYILVDARKPLFFAEGTSLKEIDINTGGKKFGSHAGPLRENQVYSGGSCDVFSKLIGSRGKDVLYVGDHIFGDIIKSKKERAWRTFLIIPELLQELVVWHEKRSIFTEIERLDVILSQKLIDLDSSAKTCPNISNIKFQIQKCIHEMDMQYGLLGSLFRTGSRQTHFASQASRYADIYAASHLNLLHYPFFYLFKAPPILMPHESTVNPYASIDEQVKSRGTSVTNNDSQSTNSSDVAALTSNGSKQFSIDLDKLSPLTVSNRNIYFGSSEVNKEREAAALNSLEISNLNSASKETANLTKPEQPAELTHFEDFDDEDDDSDEHQFPK